MLTGAKEQVFRAVYGLLSKCTRTMNDAVLLHLVNSTCKPILLYASECVCITRSDVITVTKAWNQIFYKNCLELITKTVSMKFICILELNL